MILHANMPFSTLFSLFIFLTLAFYTIRFRNAPGGAVFFIFSMLLSAILAFTSICELTSTEMTTKLIWRNIEQVPLFLAPLSFYGMVMELTGIDITEALSLAEKIRLKVEQTMLNDDYSDLLLRCTVSIGVSNMKLNQSTFNELYQKADEVLYQSKNKGRNQVTACLN